VQADAVPLGVHHQGDEPRVADVGAGQHHPTARRLDPPEAVVEGGACVEVDDGPVGRGAEPPVLHQRAVLKHLEFVGVPALPAARGVRQAVEEAWFTRRPLRVRYRRTDGTAGERVVNVRGVTMERHATLLHCVDTTSGEERHLRLDRVDGAELERAPLGG